MFIEFECLFLLVPWINLWVAVSGHCYAPDYKHSYFHVHTCMYHSVTVLIYKHVHTHVCTCTLNYL